MICFRSCLSTCSSGLSSSAIVIGMSFSIAICAFEMSSAVLCVVIIHVAFFTKFSFSSVELKSRVIFFTAKADASGGVVDFPVKASACFS